MRRYNAVLISSLIVLWSFTVQAHMVKTDVGNGADVQMSEQNDPTAASNGSELNTRFNENNRNEVVGLRFDLSEYDLTKITNVTLNVVNYRDNSGRSITVYGVTQGATGGSGGYDTETWSDTTVSAWGDLPGLETSDGLTNTMSIDYVNITQLVSPTGVGSTKGSVDSVSSAELTSFVQGFEGTNITFLLVAGNTSGGQYRFASKEATALDGGSPSGEAGDFAPYLEFDLTTDAADTNAPSVVSVSPTNGAVGVDFDSVEVVVTFDEAMDETSITSSNFFLLDGENNPVAGTVSYSPISLSATLTPDAFTLDGATTYTATVKGGSGGVTDEAGNPLTSDRSWSFTTRALTPNDPVRVVVDADSYLTNGQNGDSDPTTNHGTKSQWEVRWYDNLEGTSRIHIGYLRFDISEIAVGSFQEVTLSGTFTSSGYNSAGTWDVYGLNDNVVSNELGILGNDWGETEISYINAPGVDTYAAPGSFSFIPEDTTYLGTITLDGLDDEPQPFSSDPAELDLASFIASDTDGLVTIMLMSTEANGNEYRIDSKEGNSTGGHRPATLDFVVGSAPEPPTITGISAGAGPSIVLMWSGSSNRYHNVERTLDLRNSAGWTIVATNIPGPINVYTDAAPTEAHAAYRVSEGDLSP